MDLIIATDIFGNTDYIKPMIENCSGIRTVRWVSPYRSNPSFKNEQEAYQTYTEQCGHEQYLKKVEAELDVETDGCQEPAFLLGFSAGASAIWRALGNQHYRHLLGFLGFYPGQIRHHLNLNPCCPTRLVFPHQEPSFSVFDAKEYLEKTPKVICEISVGTHGFMNPLSNHFNAEVAKAYQTTLVNELESALSIIEN